MKVEQTSLPSVLMLTPQRVGDTRGFFSEIWNQRTFEISGVNLPQFVQENHSMSHQIFTLRGMHFQAPPHAQGKLVRCGRGRLLDVVVDIRRGSPTYGQCAGEELSYENGRQMWVPAGFLHGFVTLETDTEIIYKCTDYYAPECDGSVRWDSVGIDWSLSCDPVLSAKDATAVPFADFQSPFTYEGSK